MWGGCLAVVDELKSFGCRCYIRGPVTIGNGATVGQFYLHLNWDEFERAGAKAPFITS